MIRIMFIPVIHFMLILFAHSQLLHVLITIGLRDAERVRRKVGNQSPSLSLTVIL